MPGFEPTVQGSEVHRYKLYTNWIVLGIATFMIGFIGLIKIGTFGGKIAAGLGAAGFMFAGYKISKVK